MACRALARSFHTCILGTQPCKYPVAASGYNHQGTARHAPTYKTIIHFARSLCPLRLCGFVSYPAAFWEEIVSPFAVPPGEEERYRLLGADALAVVAFIA
jgi:hypothetical protein